MAKAPTIEDQQHNRNMRLMEEYVEMRDHTVKMREDANKHKQMYRDLVYWSCTEPQERRPAHPNYRCQWCRARCPIGVYNCELCSNNRAKEVLDQLRKDGVLLREV